MSNLEKVEKLAKLICNKNIVAKEDANIFSQDLDNIYYESSTYIGVIHEIAHYMVSDKSSRGLDNLGLPYTVKILDYDIDPLTKRMYDEECMACILTTVLFEKFITEYSDLEQSYARYFSDIADNISKDLELITGVEHDLEFLREKLTILLEEDYAWLMDENFII